MVHKQSAPANWCWNPGFVQQTQTHAPHYRLLFTSLQSQKGFISTSLETHYEIIILPISSVMSKHCTGRGALEEALFKSWRGKLDNVARSPSPSHSLLFTDGIGRDKSVCDFREKASCRLDRRMLPWWYDSHIQIQWQLKTSKMYSVLSRCHTEGHRRLD